MFGASGNARGKPVHLHFGFSLGSRPYNWKVRRGEIDPFFYGKSMRELLKRCIDFTGEVDTVGTIALAAGSCFLEIKQDLSVQLHSALENGTFGYDYIRRG